jgi:shikimate kinase
MMTDYRTIVLIGPMMAGKSTVGCLLSERLGLAQRVLDDLRWDYFDEIGYDEEETRRIVAAKGMTGLLAYWKPFEVHAVERVLAEHSNCVIDFGAGYTVQEDEALFERVEKALAPFEYVFLLRPSADDEESIRVLNERMARLLRDEGQPEEIIPEVLAANETFVRHPANGRLAKWVVYTEGKTAEETCEEIVGLIGGFNARTQGGKDAKGLIG